MTESCDLLCIDFDEAERIRGELPVRGGSADLSARFKALGDPTRLSLAYALERGEELCVCDLAWIIGSSQGLVSHHLRQLRSATLVSSRKDGKLVMYQLTDDARHILKSLSSLIPRESM